MDQKSKMDVFDADTIRDGIAGPFWREYLVPRIKDQIEICRDRLTFCNVDEVPTLQARVRTLEEWLKKPFDDLRGIKETGGVDER